MIFTGADYVVAWHDNPSSATGTQILLTTVYPQTTRWIAAPILVDKSFERQI
ncbi:MAG: hypothetical protein V1899_01390 [Planctomycetota bacterium]